MKKTLVVLSDTHCNHTVGLCLPKIKINDGDYSTAGVIRRWIFHQWEDVLEEVDKKKQGELWGIFNGDMVEADAKDRSGQVITRDRTEIKNIAHDVLLPLVEMCEGLYFLRGTEAHTGLNSTVEESLAETFDNVVENKETGKKTWWHLPLDFCGVKMDIMHHPKTGGTGRPQNSQTGVDRLASDTLFQATNERYDIPDLVIRSHLHGYKDSKDAFRTRAIITPAFTLLNAHGFRLGLSHDGELGCVLIHCDNGEYEVEPITRKPRKQKWQVVR